MGLTVDTVSVLGAHGFLLPTTSFDAEPGEVTVVAGDAGYASVTLALVIAGRANLTSGHVELDGDRTPDTLRQRVSLVDVPDVSEPYDALPVRRVLADELALAGAPSRRADVTAFLAEQDLASRAGDPFEQLAPAARTAALLASARRRRDTRVVVLDHPDRHGGDPHSWWPVLTRAADSGLVVVAIIGHATLHQLGVQTRYEIGVRA
jgi:ABC-type multidrug transport system ATPase subunit